MVKNFSILQAKRFVIFKNASVQITILIVGILLLLLFFLPLFFRFLDVFEFGFGRGNSTMIMSELIVNPNIYLDAIRFFPYDIHQYNDTFRYAAGVHNDTYSGELSLINILVMFGNPIGLFFICYLLKFTPSFRVFIFLSMFHFAPILNPLMIYLVFMFENNVRQIKEK